MRGLRRLLVWFGILAWVQCGLADPLAWTFTPDGWKPEEWILVKSPRWAYFGTWAQKEDHIQNAVPADATPDEWQGKRASDTYTSMVYGKPFAGDTRVTVSMDFTPHMAPLVVLAPELGLDASGRPEYREHFEICVYDQGVNCWHHVFKDGKPSWTKAAYAKFALKPDTRYTLEVQIKGNQVIVRIDGHEFGYFEAALPAQYYLGITGCEGLNRFYDLSIDGKLAPPKP